MKSEDIAKIAGVSRGTVSRVINNKPDVSEKTRKKIQKIIDEHGYTPNSSARKLAGKKLDILGFFIADFTKDHDKNVVKLWSHETPYFVKFMTAFLGEAKKLNYKTMLDIVTSEEECNNFESYFNGGNISGGVFMGFEENREQIENLISKGYNIALVDQKEFHNDSENLILANADDEKGGFIVTEYLIKKGHTKIAHFHGNMDIVSARLRIRGYQKALRQYGIEENSEYLVDGHYDEYITYLATKKFLKKNKNNLPTAIFFANDIMTVGGIKAIKEAGLKIKEDISVIGYDNYQYAESFDLHFSSVKIPLDKMARFSIKNLIKSINGEKHDGRYIGDVEIVERESVKEIK